MKNDPLPAAGPHCVVHGPGALLGGAAPLLSLLEQLLGVSFDGPAGPACAPALRIDFGAPEATDAGPGEATARVLQVARPSAALDGLKPLDIRFADDPSVPGPLRGRSLRTGAGARMPLQPEPGERVLAWSGDEALWTERAGAGTCRQRTAFALPVLRPGQGFVDVFNGARFIELLPLLQVLRSLVPGGPPSDAGLRATFMVDDPNLHWPTYGHVDYRVLAAQARRHRYHVCFATVPLDAWATHPGTAALFRRHRAQLSLTVHGNHHAPNELARPAEPAQRLALLRQALQRIQRLEARSGLRVSRVMVPPHGAISAGMLAALAQSGFDAACVSTGSLRAHNPGAAWAATAGYRVAELIEGCPALPRWALDGQVHNSLLLAAWLGQAMVVRAHHQDLRDGPGVFDELAGFINGLGEVHWSDMQDLAQRSVELPRPRPAPALVQPLPRAPRRPGLVLRRLLAEARDRLSVLLPRRRSRPAGHPAMAAPRSAPVKVLLLVENNSYPFDFRVRREALALHAAGYQVSVIAPRAPGQPWGEVVDGIRVRRFPAPPGGQGVLGYAVEFGYATTAIGALAVWAALRDGVDVVHAANPPDVLCAVGALLKLGGAKFVFDQHDLSPEIYLARSPGARGSVAHRLLGLAERCAYATADVVISTNQSYRQVALERGRKPADKVYVVRNGPPLSYRPLPPDPALAARAAHLIGYVGMIGPQDGLDHWLRAVHHLVHEFGRRDVLAVIIGRGDAVPALKRLAADLQIEPWVHFTGLLPETEARRWLSGASVCVQPDPFGPLNDKSTMNKLMEYMALSKPTVAFDLTETRFSAQEAALYVKPNDEREFARAVAWLLDHPEERARLGECGRLRVQEALAWEHSVPALLRAYAEGLGLRPAGEQRP